MKTLIYGAGPIGQYYAFFLHQAGKDVSILARGATYSRLEKKGIRLRDGYSNDVKTARVKVVSALDRGDDYDLVLVAMSKRQRLSICPILAENRNLISVLFVGNDVSGFKRYSDYLPEEKTLLGFPGVGGGFVDDALTYTDKDKAGGKKRPLYIGKKKPSAHLIRTFFESAGIPVTLVSDMDGWLKYHVAFIAPVAGVYFHCQQDFKAVQNNPDALLTYIKATKEAGNVLKAAGYRKRQPFIINLYYWLPERLNAKIFRDKFFGSRFVEVAMGLHANAIGRELWDLIDEFRALQKMTAVKTPHLDILFRAIPKGEVQVDKAI